MRKNESIECIDNKWLETILGLIGEQFGEQINGAIVQARARQDRISIWTKDCNKSTGTTFSNLVKPWSPIIFQKHSNRNSSLKGNYLYCIAPGKPDVVQKSWKPLSVYLFQAVFWIKIVKYILCLKYPATFIRTTFYASILLKTTPTTTSLTTSATTESITWCLFSKKKYSCSNFFSRVKNIRVKKFVLRNISVKDTLWCYCETSNTDCTVVDTVTSSIHFYYSYFCCIL